LFSPLHARRAHRVYIESQGVFVHKVAFDAKRAGVKAQDVTSLVEQVGGEFPTKINAITPIPKAPPATKLSPFQNKRLDSIAKMAIMKL